MRRISYYEKAVRRIGALMLGGLLTVGLCGCDEDEDNYLEGSMTDSYDFGFDSVRAVLYPSSVSIDYMKSKDGQPLFPCKVTINTPPSEIKTGVDYKIDGEEASLVQGAGYGTLELPPISSGKIRLDEFAGKAGSTVSGSFEALFTGSKGNILNLRGGFNAKLIVPPGSN
ncbi:MAG: hypothetical protein JXR76_23190 [Deltaproteobacteria bacterium]|nr:hypothetical protein [Deltaproteobacteria bacterium]